MLKQIKKCSFNQLYVASQDPLTKGSIPLSLRYFVTTFNGVGAKNRNDALRLFMKDLKPILLEGYVEIKNVKN